MRYLAVLVILLHLAGCSNTRFIKLEQTAAPVLDPVTSLLAYRFISLQQQDAASIARYCQALRDQSPSSQLYLLQLACAERWLAQPLSNSERQAAIALYNAALLPLVRAALQPAAQQPAYLALQLEVLSDDGLPLTHFTLAADVQAKDPLMHAPSVQSLGISLVGQRPNTGQGRDRWYPPEGIFRAVTVLPAGFDFRNPVQPLLRLQARVMTQAEELQFGEQRYPVHYDLATPYLLLAEAAQVDRFELTGLLRAAEVESKLGIYVIEPLVTDKIPILMIHGLYSSPLIWRRLRWAIYADPQLAKRYQIWHAFYPTGPPPFFNAMRLRRELDQLRAELHSLAASNSAATSPALAQMWLIGHSMGGIISRTMVVDSGNALWDRTFKVAPEQLRLEEQALEPLREIFFLTPKPYVSAVVFLDTPHQGSDQARGLAGRLASSLIRLPGSMYQVFSRLWQDERMHYLTDEMRPYMSAQGPDSVRVLSPSHPLLQELSKLQPQVPVYSVIGNNRPKRCQTPLVCPGLNDGVVSYHSAHLPQAQAELIVPSKHDSYQSPEAIAFILQQLTAWQSAN